MVRGVFGMSFTVRLIVGAVAVGCGAAAQTSPTAPSGLEAPASTTQPARAQSAPATDAPAKDAPAKDATGRDAPAKDATAKDVTRASGRGGRAEFGRQTLTLTYEPQMRFKQSAGPRGELGWSGQDLRLSAPLYQDAVNEWLFLANVGVLDFYGDARLPDRRWWQRSRSVEFPDELWDVEVGASYRRKLANDWIAGGVLTIGSPSDKPFASGDEVAVDVTGSLRIPHGPTNAWLIYLNWSNTRDFAPYIPLPGLGYEFEAGPQLGGVAGFPFSRVRWQPVEWLSVRGSYLFPRSLDAELAVPVAGWELFTGYAWTNDQWLWSERRDDDDRLQFYEQSVRVGLRSPAFLDGVVRLEVEGGYAFQSQWFVGDEYSDRKEGRLGVGDGPFARVQARFSF
ncbi:MAG: hypothetical protein AMXMBFR47_39770 [Planctomycetota bacterium]